MLLVAVATDLELKPLQQFVQTGDQVQSLVTGMGPVIAAASLSKHLAFKGATIKGVLNIGVAGAYVSTGINKLDICLARREFLGDFGICMQDSIVDFEPEITQPQDSLLFDNKLNDDIEKILQENNIEYKTANFVTVNCASGTQKRGDYLRDKYGAGCENMEGGAVALACNSFNIPCVQLRCVSNMVEDRNTENWQLEQAIEKICQITETVLRELA